MELSGEKMKDLSYVANERKQKYPKIIERINDYAAKKYGSIAIVTNGDEYIRYIDKKGRPKLSIYEILTKLMIAKKTSG